MKRVYTQRPLALILLLLVTLFAVPNTGWAAPVAALTGNVSAADGTPLHSVSIEVFQYGGGLVATTATDAHGSFTVTVPAGGERLYWVRAWAKEYATAEQAWVLGREGSLHLTLAPVFGSISGWVEGPESQPVGSARVELVHPTRGTQVTTTAPSGRFWFHKVPAADGYSLRVSAPGLVPVVIGVGQVTADRETSVAFALKGFAGTVTGTVENEETGTALRGATVAVEQVGVGIVATAVTAAGGSFTANVPVVAGATYRVHARLSNYRPTETDPFALNDQGRAQFTGESRIRLAPLFTELTGRVLDPDGDPVPEAPLWLERRGVGIIATGVTDADGTFRFDGLLTGDLRYRVRLVPPVMRKSHTERKWAETASEWVTPVAGHRTHLALSLVNGQPQDYGEAEIMGLVTSPGRYPVAGAQVELVRPGEGVVATTETAADGSYRFTGVEANRSADQTAFRGYLIHQPGTSYVVRVSHGAYFQAASEPIDVMRDQEAVADLTLQPLRATAMVHVADQNGLPLEGAQVTLHPAQGGDAIRSTTNATGTARVQAPLLGAYWVEVAKSGYASGQASSLVLTAGQETVLDLTLGATAATVYGTVLDQMGRPVTTPLSITALAADGRELRSTVNPDGSYAIADLPAGTPALLSLRNGADLLAAPSQVVVANSGERVRLDLTLPQPTGSVSGRLLDPSGKPVGDTVISLMRSGSGKVMTTRTDANGFYRFEQVAAGLNQRYAVRVEQPGFGYRQLGNRMPPPLFLLESGQTVYVDLVQTQLPQE